MRDAFGTLRLLYRVPWLLLHIVLGLPLIVLTQSAAGRGIRLGGRLGGRLGARSGGRALNEITLTWWAGTVCRIFGLERRVSGQLGPGPLLVVANHISWIDIPLLHSLGSMGFVGKAEIDAWPVLGWMARVGETVFHQRGSHDSASGVVTAMTERLRAGRRVAIFPEGGILPGAEIKRFHARMFGAAIADGAPVQPVMLRYSRRGVLHHDITFRPREHFLGNFLRLLAQPKCIAEIRLLPPIDPALMQRRQLAGETEAAVRSAFASELPGA
jgi:1-acyl-sn-glycerol-3-phosphate acyltransferase